MTTSTDITDRRHSLGRSGFVTLCRAPLIDIRWWAHRDLTIKLTLGRRSFTIWTA